MSNTKIPDSWAVVQLDKACDINPKHKDIVDDSDVGFVPMAQVSEAGKLISIETKKWKQVKKGFTHFCDNDVIFAKITPCMENKKSAVVSRLPNGIGCGSTEFHVLRPRILEPQFLLSFLRQDRFVNEAERNMTGSAGQKRVPTEWLRKQAIPIPPVAEQKRIVAKIESTHEKIGIVESLISTAQTRIKLFRRALFEKLLSDFELVPLEVYITDKPRNGYSPKPSQKQTNVKTLTLGATTSGLFNPDKYKFVDEDIPLSSHLWLNDGDILIQRSNSLEHVGVSAIYRGPQHTFIYPDLMMKIQANENTTPEFLHIALSSPLCREYFRNKANGAAGNMPKINQGTVLAAPIPKCSLEEQRKIIQEMNRATLLSNVINKMIDEIKSHSILLKDSVLFKAFSGTLVSQDPTEGTGSQLLEKIKSQQEFTTKMTKISPTDSAPRRKRAKK